MSHLNLIGATGEYFVCAELCRKGVLAILTPKNNPLFDIVATSLDGQKSVTIQVKTRSIQNKLGWRLGAKFSATTQNIDFVVLVNLLAEGSPEYYVYTHTELAKRVESIYASYISQPKKDGMPRKDVGFRWFDENSFSTEDKSRKNNWSKIIDKLQ
ncbi:hypothetical protein WIT60_16780 [Aquabacterium sp. G14]|uniref:hypothetical protein n=1 Tax=Aquabacterium sp. G14 TaxID=3130164 RepID=UPI0030B10213